MIFLIDMNSPVVILLLILGCAALIAVIALIIYKILHPKLKQDKRENYNVKNKTFQI